MPKLTRRSFLVSAGIAASAAALEACRPPSIIQVTATPPPTQIPDPTQPPVLAPEMVLVEPGTFMMGADSHIRRDERPAHPVRITTPYYIAKYLVTFDDYDLYCESTGRPLLDDRGWGRGSMPAFGLNWHDATDYCIWLSLQSDLSPAVQEFPGGTWCDFSAEGYRLPTEAEWEYAARGGNSSQGFLYAGSNDPQEVAWYTENSDGRPHPVGEKAPNELELYDLSGNVWEHCWDWYSWNFYFFTAEAYGDTPIDNPQGDYPVVHVNKAMRGGSFASAPEELRITNRGYDLPGGYGIYGIRLVRTGLPLATDRTTG